MNRHEVKRYAEDLKETFKKRPKSKLTHRPSLIYIRSDKRVHTNEDWFPTWEGGQLKVSVLLCTYIWQRPSVRVCVWGGDDYGFERDWDLKSAEQAVEFYQYWVRRISGWTYLTESTLRGMGFWQS